MLLIQKVLGWSSVSSETEGVEGLRGILRDTLRVSMPRFWMKALPCSPPSSITKQWPVGAMEGGQRTEDKGRRRVLCDDLRVSMPRLHKEHTDRRLLGVP